MTFPHARREAAPGVRFSRHSLMSYILFSFLIAYSKKLQPASSRS
jgi:hypothetical protein